MIKALVVDDEKLVRKGLISVMPWEQYGFSVVGEASNGEKALEFIQANAVDLAFIDLAMPVMSGLDLMHRLHEEFPAIFMVVLTCHADFEYVREALRLGAIDYIVKTQLEKEKMESVLDRIARRIRRGNPAGAAAPVQDAAARNAQESGRPLREKHSEEIVASIFSAVRFLKEHLGEEVSQDIVAKKVSMSRGYFSHCFKELMGCSFGDFVRDLKIEKAREMLAQTNKPVYWIAEQTGFQDEKYFSRFFKEHVGLLPTEYRNKSRE